MEYYSTNNRSIKADFRQATIKGQPDDKGLYFPAAIPRLSNEFFESIKELTKEQIAFDLIKPYVGNTITDEILKRIIKETVAFDFPLVPINDSVSTLELFHGPTLAFKDVGARFMSRCLGYFSEDENRCITVLVATSGDTGSAVADAFYDVERVDVVILYPSGKVSGIQERQLTTFGKNITALEVDGDFDDCQRMVKECFADAGLNKLLRLTSANSINVARWLPQQFFYFYAHQQWALHEPPVISVPSGNFGNICAGLLAYHSGLPVKRFIAACNSNDTVCHYLTTGEMRMKSAKKTLSNAMDVSNPSNFVRILELFNQDTSQLKEMLTCYNISDEETVKAMKQVNERYHYLLDPHGAVGYVSLQRYLREHRSASGYFMETAHPVKFDVEKIMGEQPAIPERLQRLMQLKKLSVKIKPDTRALKDYLTIRTSHSQSRTYTKK